MPIRVLYEAAVNVGTGSGTAEDVTSRVRLYTLDLAQNAEEGSVAISSLTIDDPLGDYDIVGWRRVWVYEDSAVGSNTLMYLGWVAPDRNVSRGPFVTGAARVWETSLSDMNALISMRVLNGSDANRPSESDVARINWLMGTNEMSRITETEYISAGNAKNMDAVDYRGQTLIDVINDCAQQSGKNFFVYNKQTGGATSTRGLWYDFPYSIAYSSPLRLSNVASDIPAPTDASYRGMILGNGPVAYWRLGESSGTVAADSAGGNTGTYVNTPTLGVASLVPNELDTAATFSSASSEYITVPDAASLDLGDVLTIEMWVKPATLGFSYLMNKGSGSYALWMGADGVLHFYMSGIGDLAHSSISLVAGSTYHVVCTKNGATRKIYINGVDRTTLDSNNTLTNTASPLIIGADDAVGNHWNGTLDEVALYPTALTAAQVLAHYTGAVDNNFTFAIAEDTTLVRDASRTYSGAYVRYDGGAVYEESISTSNLFTRRDAVYDASNVKNATTATNRAIRYLGQSDDEEDRIKTAFWVPAAKVNFVKPGMRIQFKASHLPGYTSFSWGRVLKHQIKEISEIDEAGGVKYLVSLELSTAAGVAVGGGCSSNGGTLTIHTFAHASFPDAKWRLWTGPTFPLATVKVSNIGAGDYTYDVPPGECSFWLDGLSGGQGVPFDGITWTPSGGSPTDYAENGDGNAGHFFEYRNAIPATFTGAAAIWDFPVYGYSTGGRTGDYGLGLNNGIAFVLP